MLKGYSERSIYIVSGGGSKSPPPHTPPTPPPSRFFLNHVFISFAMNIKLSGFYPFFATSSVKGPQFKFMT